MRDLQTIDPTFQKMRRLATALLMVMVVLYVLARSFEGDASFWPWVKAFAEAAMVGDEAVAVLAASAEYGDAFLIT